MLCYLDPSLYLDLFSTENPTKAEKSTMSSLQRLVQIWPLQSVMKLAESYIRQMPLGLQNLFRSKLLQNGLAALVVFRLLKKISDQLSWYSLNNYTKLPEWKPHQELVLLTGGNSGIGAEIMKDLSRHGAKVVILDVQEPKAQLRMFSIFPDYR